MENNNEITLGIGATAQTSLAHEQLARNEQFVGMFLAVFISNLNKDKYLINNDKIEFINNYLDIELYISQRMFIKRMIESPVFKDLIEYIVNLIDKSYNSSVTPLEQFMSSFNKGDKAFLIRQIFRHSEQVIEKYRFIQNFIDIPVQDIDMDILNKKMWQLPIEQQLLACSSVFSKIKDEHSEERETLNETIKKLDKSQSDKTQSSDEEVSIHKFFNAFYIQYLLHKDFANTNILRLNFMENYGKEMIYASQRVFIKNLLGHTKFRILCEEMKSLFCEYNDSTVQSPSALFLKRVNSKLVLQVFNSPQDNEKYKFLPSIIKNLEQGVDFDVLYNKIWHLSQEQQIVICAYLFNLIHDGQTEKKKVLRESFLENCMRMDSFHKKSGKGSQIETDNVTFFINFINAMSKYK